ncbi:uncharacterized protein Tco025E_05548 [Trypanosoma conorhini]|uniref:Uncharacterized protein n=1 Tax=Trypanosoma conorhini TaxID=83891 RepID=A0A3R7LIT2_9TRYP|nr:uncharacterized protein Tco025E_05548 [Trypanosoma conorhini]RNF15325.1 hypothetical protein Tco025E_05548 [Trypanosoma conorhini]
MSLETVTNMPGISPTRLPRVQKITPLLAANLIQPFSTSATPRADNAMQLSLGHYEPPNKSPTSSGGAATRVSNCRVRSGSLNLSITTIPEEIDAGTSEVATRAVVQRPRDPHTFVSKRVVSSKTAALFDVFGHYPRPVNDGQARRMDATLYKQRGSQSIDAPPRSSCSSVIDECLAVRLVTPDDNCRQSEDVRGLDPSLPPLTNTFGPMRIVPNPVTTTPVLRGSTFQMKSSAPRCGDE